MSIILFCCGFCYSPDDNKNLERLRNESPVEMVTVQSKPTEAESKDSEAMYGVPYHGHTPAPPSRMDDQYKRMYNSGLDDENLTDTDDDLAMSEVLDDHLQYREDPEDIDIPIDDLQSPDPPSDLSDDSEDYIDPKMNLPSL